MKKRVICILGLLIIGVILISFVGVVSSDSTTNDTNSTNETESLSSAVTVSDVDSSYQCLSNKAGNKTDLSLQEAVFSTLALGEKSNLIKVINDNKKSSENCWPKSACTLKDTALVALAYNRIGKDTSGIQSWLKTKNATSSELAWYIEIDLTGHTAGSCQITYGTTTGTASIGSDMAVSLTGSITNCLSSSGYWLRVKDSCIEKKFEVKCDNDFITTLLYQKSGADTIYVSSETHSASSLGTTEETIGAKCLKTGSVCDYEGTLWAALALQKTGNDVSAYIPYLMALADENTKYFPSAFIYLTAGGSEPYSDIIGSQKQSKYWEITSGNRFYDTALAMLALYGSGANEFENAKTYLLGIRDSNGCWNNNIRDTAFLLYAGWPETITTTSEGGGNPVNPDCAASGKYCSGSFDCTQAGGTVFYAYECPGVLTCCSINPLTQTCTSLNGVVCASDETCSGTSSPSIDGSCCVSGSCGKTQQQFTCEQTTGRYCRATCNSDENQVSSETCDSGNICCEVTTNNGSTTTSHTWIWILLLGILIVVVIIGILMRDKIRLAWYKYQGKAKTSPAGPRGPGMPPIMNRMPIMRPMQRPMPVQRRPLPEQRKPASGKDNEMEETLRKLREMSK